MFSLYYNSDFRHFEDSNEIIFYYTDNPDLVLLKKISETNKIVIDVTEVPDDSWIEIIAGWKKLLKKDITVKMMRGQYHISKDAIKENNLTYFFDLHIRSWDDLDCVVKEGVSEVYITDSFGFELQDILVYCRDANVKIRVYPNVAQRGFVPEDENPDIHSFFVRPEDINLFNYDEVTFEFFNVLNKVNTVYDIYKRGTWNDELDILISGLDTEGMLNQLLPQEFGLVRTNCRKKCHQGRCILCEKMFANALLTEERVREFSEQKKEEVNEPVIIEDNM